jgi:hypothetical protein
MSDNDNQFSIELVGFNEGFSPLAHIDSKSFVGNKGQASEMKADVISLPGFLTQSPALANLTNGTQAGVVDQLIRFILDKPTASDTTYAVGTTKLFKLSSTAVISGGTPSWPQAVTNMTEGESVIRLKANLYTFYNKSSGGDIAQMPLSTEVIDPDWGSSNDAALEKAPHPCAVKEDIMVFGNGRYLGVYIEGSATLDVQKLDFGEGSEVADVLFHSNTWWVAVNFGEGKRSQIYLYDGSAMSNILSDEVAVGDQKIGFLYVKNGIVYIAYDDKSSVGFAIGWLNGRTITPLRYFPGSLPNHRQKTLYKNTLLFISTTDIWSIGAPVEQLPVQISKLADAGYATVGGMACPFGVPMVASNETIETVAYYRLAKFSGYSTDSNWKSIMLDLTSEKDLGKINNVIVITKALVGSAKALITLEGNQGAKTSNTLTVETAGKTRHIFNTITLGAVEDLRAIVSFASSDTTNYCPIRKIILLGSFVER